MTSDRRPLSILVCRRAIPAAEELKHTLAAALERSGHAVTTVSDGDVELAGYDVILLAANPAFFPRVRRTLLKLGPADRPLVVCRHSEPLPPPRASGLPRWPPLSLSEIGKIVLRDPRATDIYTNALALGRMVREGTLHLVVTSSREKLEYLQEQGYGAVGIPVGFPPGMGRRLDLERDVDVLFLGDARPLRRRRHLRYLRRQGIDVLVRGSWHDRALWGDNRTHFLNRTKIIVHLQRYPGKLAGSRFLMAMASGTLVVAEPIYKPEPFLPGTHFVMAPVDEMPALIRYYLDRPAERERVTDAAYRLVTEGLPYDRTSRALLDAIEEKLRARGATPSPAVA